MMTVFWLIVVAVALVIEIFTMGLTTIWFGLGAVAAAITAAIGGPLWLQIVLFSVVSVVIMLLVRPFAMKVMKKGETKTNVDSLIGKQVVVIETIDNVRGTGKVKCQGVEWMARSTDDSVYAVDDLVVIDSVSGVKLIVKK